MTEISAINYYALSFGNQKANSTSNDTDYTDGLSVSEMQKLDTNGDGMVTEAEFKAGFNGKDASKYWDTYKKFYNVTSQSNKVTQKLDNGAVVETTLDTNGKMKSYKITSPSKSGGVVRTYNNNGEVTSITSNGTTVQYDSNGNVTSINASNMAVNLSYSNGKVSSVKIGTTNYNKITEENGKITVKDSNGKVVFTMESKSNSEISAVTYNNQKKSQGVLLGSSGVPVSSITYDSNGNPKKEVYNDSGFVTIYDYSSDGKIKSSTDYASLSDYRNGKKYGSQTYLTTDGSTYYSNNSDPIPSTRTYYDENGNVKLYEEYSYEKQDDGSVKVTEKGYSSTNKSKLMGSRVVTQDKYGNRLKEVMTGSDGKESTITYSYNVSNITSKLRESDLAGTVNTLGSNIIYSYYTEGLKTSEIKESIVDGKSSVSSKEYSYTKNGVVESITDAAEGSDTSVKTKYNTDGSIAAIENYNSENKKISEQKYNAKGEVTEENYYSNEILRKSKKKNADGTFTYSIYNGEGKLSSEEKVDSNGKVTNGKYTIKDLIKALYPEIWTKQLNDISEQVAAQNGKSLNDLISYDWTNGTCGINIPALYSDSGIYRLKGSGKPVTRATNSSLSANEFSSNSVLKDLKSKQSLAGVTVTNNDDGSYSQTTTNALGEVIGVENYSKDGKLTSGQYTIKDLIKKLYPNIWTKQLIDISEQVAQMNGLSTSDLVNYDWSTNSGKITIPELKVVGGIYRL